MKPNPGNLLNCLLSTPCKNCPQPGGTPHSPPDDAKNRFPTQISAEREAPIARSSPPTSDRIPRCHVAHPSGSPGGVFSALVRATVCSGHRPIRFGFSVDATPQCRSALRGRYLPHAPARSTRPNSYPRPPKPNSRHCPPTVPGKQVTGLRSPTEQRRRTSPISRRRRAKGDGALLVY